MVAKSTIERINELEIENLALKRKHQALIDYIDMMTGADAEEEEETDEQNV